MDPSGSARISVVIVKIVIDIAPLEASHGDVYFATDHRVRLVERE